MSTSATGTQIKVSPHTIPGMLHQQNQGAFDWGWQGLLAYGCHATVVVVEPRSVQPLQTLAHHKTNVVKVRWAPTMQHHSLNSPYSLRVASVDQSCVCVVWDVGEGSVYTEFSLGSRTLIDLQWLSINDSCRSLLAVLVAPSTMTIWNTDTGTKVSRFTFTETIHAFLFNPFKTDNLVLQSTDCLIFISEFNPGRNPTAGGKKFYLTSSESATPLPGRGKTPYHLRRQLIAGDQLRGEETLHFSDSVQLLFSPCVRHRLFVIFPKEINVVDLEMRQAVGVIALDRTASPFRNLLPCTQRDILYCLHENGCVSVRVNQCLNLPSPQTTFSPVGGAESQEVRYITFGHSEPLRINKSCQVYSGALCPTTEKEVAVLTSEGRILFWECDFEQVGVSGVSEGAESQLTLLTSHPVRGVDLVSVGAEVDEGYGADRGQGISLDQTVAPTWFTPPENSMALFGLLSLKLTLGRLWTGITGTPTAVRMSPPLTTRNWLTYAPLLAVGTSTGSVLIFNLAKRVLTKEFSIFSFPVYGIEWTSQTSFASFAHMTTNSSGLVRNEVAFTDMQTGTLTFLKRPDVPGNLPQTPIETIKISHHKTYVVVKYTDRPLEFYEAKTGVFLREMVTNPPSFSCIDWTPNHGRHKTLKVDPLALGKSSSAVDFDLAMGASDGRASHTSNKEMLTVMDENGSMWQICIDGSKVKVANSTPTQTWLNNPTCITWKSDLMVAGDVNGVLIFYDAKGQTLRTVETPRAAVKKLRFAPGKGNSKLIVLYNSRLDIRDAISDTVLSQQRWSVKDRTVLDADWATSDKLVLLTSEGCVRVCGVSLKYSQSPVNTTELAVPIFCPHVLSAQSSLYLKALLQHQPWRMDYSLDSDSLTEVDTVEKEVKEQLESLPDEYHEALIEARLGVAERCQLVADLYGDQREAVFWRVALYYISREHHRMKDPQYDSNTPTHRRNPSTDIFQPDSEASVSIGSTHRQTSSLDDLLGPIAEGEGEGGDSLSSFQALPTSSIDDIDGILHEAELRALNDTLPLDTNFDLLCDSTTYKRNAMEKVLLFDSRRQTYDQTRRCAETLMLLGQTDRAVQMLLETDSSSNEYYTDALKACLAATIRSSGASQSTIKLVATNLIANSRLMEGVQLLCLIDKSQDSCRYLQTYGEWLHSVWLAKVTLRERDANEVFARWAEHLALSGVNQKNLALLVYLSLGKFTKVIEMLYSMRHFDQAALFAEACLDRSLIRITKATGALLEAVFLEYARYLHGIQLVRGVRHYCNKAGDKGEQLLGQLMPSSRPVII